MALPYTDQLEAVTLEHFMFKEAQDNYFQSSWLVKALADMKKGLYETTKGGTKQRVPIWYDEQKSAWYVRGDTTDSTKVDFIHSAYFTLRHNYTNATILGLDELENSGPEGVVNIVTSSLENAQATAAKKLAQSIYTAGTDSGSIPQGLPSTCSETSDATYAGVAEDDLVSTDGTKVWQGYTDSTGGAVSLDKISSLLRASKVFDGPKGRADIVVTTGDLWDTLEAEYRAAQIVTKETDPGKLGFRALNFKGADVVEDDYCTSGAAYGINTNFYGVAFHEKGKFRRGKWKDIPNSPEDRTMKIYLHMNWITNYRRAQVAFTGLTA